MTCEYCGHSDGDHLVNMFDDNESKCFFEDADGHVCNCEVRE